MSRKIYNRLSFMALSWLDESTLGLCRADANGMSLNYLMVGGRGVTRTRGHLLAKQAQIQSKSLLRLRLLV